MVQTFDKRLIMVAGIAGSLLWGAAANAQTISFGVNGVQAGPSIGSPTFSGGVVTSSGVFTSITMSATGFPAFGFGNPYAILLGNTINVSTLGAGTIDLYITEQGITASSGATGVFASNYAVTQISGATITVTEQTYYDAANLKFTTPTALGAGLTSANGTAGIPIPISSASIPLAGVFSVTELFHIVALGSGSTNDTINLDLAVTGGALGTPLPAALPLFGSVLGGGFLFGRLRNRRKARAQLAAV